MIELLDGLNTEQRAAVTHTEGPLLIIAGAGTGKTTVVTRRIAYLIQEGLAQPDEILALTFTDKAAGEMQERVEALLPLGYVDLWVSTFHAFGERILHDHALDIGIPNDFRLLSDTDQWLLLREHLDEFELDYYRPKGNPTKFVQALITHFSRLKDEDITPAEYLTYAEQLQLDADRAVGEQAHSDEARRVMEVAAAYKRYQELLLHNSALDFGDLITETIHLFHERPRILDQYRTQFTYILVDEFQDANYAQYALIKMLAAPRNNLTVVGDDDQAIYSFRGASMSNILIFKKDFPSAKEISLVQNYRSTQAILDLAYDFIQHNNPNRLESTLQIDKRLRSTIDGERLIEHLHSETLEGEAKMVVDQIIALKEASADLAWSDIAILVRANDHAATFIPYLERSQIPYQFYASQGLFAKPVMLDVIAFLKLLDNYHESRAMYRVLTYPFWRLPSTDMMRLLHEANKRTQSIYDLCREIRSVSGLDEKTYVTIESMLALIDKLATLARYKTAGEITLLFLEQSGYLKWMTQQPQAESSELILYLNQFYKYIEAFEKTHAEKTVRNFIRELTLMIEAGEEGRLQPDFSEGPDAVKIMTVHGSKGLEFSYVFVVNLVDKRFPSVQRRDAIPVPDAIVKDIVPEGDVHVDEERRLMYVAMTRAKRGLFLTSAQDYGGARKKKPSRFLVECGFVDTRPEPTGEVLFGSQQPRADMHEKEVLLAHVPSTFSYTQLKAFETCPWQYRFAFLLKVPTPGKPSFSFGKTMHATLYEFFRRLKEQGEQTQGALFGAGESRGDRVTAPTQEELLRIYEEQWMNEWYQNRKQRDDYYEKGREALKAFYALHTAQWPHVLFLEKKFGVRLSNGGKQGVKMKGAIDRVDSLDGGVEIVDYKTGKFPKSGTRDMEQLYLYALAVKQVFELEPVKLTYYFIEENKTLSTEFDGRELEKVSAWAVSIVEKILKGDFPPTPGFHCQFCDFREICEYRK